LRMRSATSHSAARPGTASPSSASSSTRATASAPVIIEVEPVVRRLAAVVLEPRRVFVHRVVHDLLPAAAGLAQVLQHLEMDIVAVAAPVQADHEHERLAQHGGEAKRSDREARRLAEEVARGGTLALDVAIGEHADELSGGQRLLHLQHRIDRAERDHGYGA